MTIAVAVRTGSAVVYATDSKITTRGLAGFNPDGTPNWLDQTYDNATKVVHDRNKVLMAMAAGTANVGQMPVGDFIERHYHEPEDTAAKEDAAITQLLERMNTQKKDFFTKTGTPPESWPGPTLLMTTASPEKDCPRTWTASLAGENYTVQEILATPSVHLGGSYREVFSLLYGFDIELIGAVGKELGATEDQIVAALSHIKQLRPIDKLNLWTMPLQDAIDLAVFLANVQIEMDRFLPGMPACGGPIDVMVLRMVPEPRILTFPGKDVHHPLRHGSAL